MISNQNVVRCVVTIGLVLGAALTCFAQLDPIVPDSTQEVGLSTGDPVIQERAGLRERISDRTVVVERVVERRREGEVYIAGFGGFTWGHDFNSVAGTDLSKNSLSGPRVLPTRESWFPQCGLMRERSGG